MSEELKHKHLFCDRVDQIILVFYGLAIASGLQFAADPIFKNSLADLKAQGYDAAPRWIVVWAVTIATTTSATDWLGFAWQKRGWRSPKRLIFDLAFPVSLFSLFTTAHILNWFFVACSVFSFMAIVFFMSDACHEWEHIGQKKIKCVCYGFIMAICIASVISDKKFGHEAMVTKGLRLGAGITITSMLLLMTIGAYQKLKERLPTFAEAAIDWKN